MSEKPARIIAVDPWESYRFWRKVQRNGPDNCWEWKGARIAGGYGRVKIGGRAELAHRVAFALSNEGVVAKGAVRLVLHSCDNPGCCNPRHLRLGTFSDNNSDMVARNRHPAHLRKRANTS